MKKTLAGTAVLALLCLGVATQAWSITLPDGTLTAVGIYGYNYSISSTTINAQSAETHVTGTVTGYTLPINQTNVWWFSIGLITQAERDRVLGPGGSGVPDQLSLQSAFMQGAQGSSGYVVMPGDYGSNYGGTGQPQGISNSFTFDLKLVPTGSAGGMEYLSINGGAYGDGLAYGKDQFNNYGYSYPTENLSSAYLIAQIYVPQYDSGTYSISYQNVTATPTPIPGAVWLLGSGVIGLIGLKRRQSKRP